jgi:hypothetical protein
MDQRFPENERAVPRMRGGLTGALRGLWDELVENGWRCEMVANAAVLAPKRSHPPVTVGPDDERRSGYRA